MNQAIEKSEREKRVFSRFLDEFPGQLPGAVFESREPPEPDILCTFESGERVAFELAEICDSDIAELESRRDTQTGHFIYTTDPSSKIVLNKFRKCYQTDHPKELLLYWDGRAVSPDDVVAATIQPLFHGVDHEFRRAWYLGENALMLVYESL